MPLLLFISRLFYVFYISSSWKQGFVVRSLYVTFCCFLITKHEKNMPKNTFESIKRCFCWCCFAKTRNQRKTREKKSNKIFVEVLWVVFLFTFFKNFVCCTREKVINKENVTVVKITSTWSSDIGRSYKLVKGGSCSIEVSNQTEDLGMLGMFYL